MPKKRRVYISRVVGNQVMTSADLERLHKYMLEIEGIDAISDEMRAVVEEEWPELVHRLPPKKWVPASGQSCFGVFWKYPGSALRIRPRAQPASRESRASSAARLFRSPGMRKADWRRVSRCKYRPLRARYLWR